MPQISVWLISAKSTSLTTQTQISDLYTYEEPASFSQQTQLLLYQDYHTF